VQEVHLTLQLGGGCAEVGSSSVWCGAVWCSVVQLMQCAVVQGGKGWCIVEV